MADIPTIQELQTEIENDLRTELGITRAWFGKVFLRIIALVQAAKLKLYYLAIAMIQKNIFVDTADSEANGGTLERFGRVKLGRNPFPAVAGVYTLTVTGAIGGVIPAGRTFKSTVSSTNPDKIYEVLEQVTLTSTSGIVEVIALEAGAGSALIVDDQLEATAPIADVNNLAVVATVETTAVDQENIETYRRLTIEGFQLEPQGGAATDYRIWSSDAAGVRTVYPYTKDGAIYTVQVYVEAEEANTDPGFPIGTPPASMLTDVAEVIELDPDTTKELSERGRRPLQAVVEVLAATPIPVTVTINDLSDKSASVLAAINAAIEASFYNIRPYIAGADGTNKNDTIYISTLIAAIYNAISSGINFSNVVFSIGGVDYSQYTFGDTVAKYGQYPYLTSLLTP